MTDSPCPFSREVDVEDIRFHCSFYYRRAIAVANPDQMRELALTLLDELEDHRKVFREYGISPPLRHDPEEICALILSHLVSDPDRERMAP
ncbi:MAG TPA: hypothetical protein VK041_04605 [Opitutales bacterium]|nr:hypothetical protein [Opitutales bacterium]